MQIRNWPAYHPLLVLVTLLASLTIASTRQRQLPGDPWNQRSNQLMLINSDDYSVPNSAVLPSQDSMETLVETFKVPKRTLSLFTRWKTLEQLRRNHLHPPIPMESSGFDPPTQRQQKKISLSSSKAPKEEMMVLPGMSSEMSLSARAIQRSLRPPGQPLRWG